MKVMIAAAVAFIVGFGCRWFDIPAPAPPMLQGALLVVAMTLGYMGANYLKSQHPQPSQPPAAQVEAAKAPRSAP
jgi:XapX domain-containing protein